MKRSIAIRFDGPVLRLDLDQVVTDFKSTVQNAMVNLMTDADEDLIFPTRGTQLFGSAVGGSVFNLRSASHACNFAASDTLFFSRETGDAESAHHLADISLVPETMLSGRLTATAGFLSQGGENLSYLVPDARTS